jgi:hypothetical protein
MTILSADSHITEPPNCYIDNIDPAWRDKAPRLVDLGQNRGEGFIVDGMKKPVVLGTVAAAGKKPEEIKLLGSRFDDLHRGGWDPEARMADQDRDGVSAEVIYPSVGMVLCNHRDADYKKACFDAYNRWLAGYCATHPDRLIGLGQTAMRSPEEGITDLLAIRSSAWAASPCRGSRPPRRTTTRRSTTSSGKRRSTSRCRCRSTSSPCDPRSRAAPRWPGSCRSCAVART